jgi:hypothetical protein
MQPPAFIRHLGHFTLAVSLLTACNANPPQTTASVPPSASPVMLPPSPAAKPTPVKPAAPLKPRSLRLQLKLSNAMAERFGLKQVDLSQCSQNLSNVQTVMTFPSELPTETQTALQAAGVTVRNESGQTILEFANTLEELTSEELGLEYTLNDLPTGSATAQTIFRDAANQELGYLDYEVTITETSATTVVMELRSTGEEASIDPCPRLEASLTGATLTGTGGDLSAAPAGTPTPTPSGTPTPTPSPSGAVILNPPVVESLSATTGHALDTITITGLNFTGASNVTFAGVSAYSFTVDSDTQITAQVPNAFTSGKVMVINSAGNSQSSETFTRIITSLTPRIIRVRAGVADGGDGSSWSAAYNRLELALYLAEPNDEIWVSSGRFVPTTPEIANRAATFQLRSNIPVYGGFNGTESTREERNPTLNRTILSGDISGNDNYSDADFSDVEENSYHVVTGASQTILDGVTIIGGNADGPAPYDRGGGIYNNGVSPTLNNVILNDHRALNMGAAMYNVNGAAPVLTSFQMENNASPNVGGAIYSHLGATPTLTNGLIRLNSAKFGGAMFQDSGTATLTNVQFMANTASTLGGGIFNRRQAPMTLTNVTFDNNRAVMGAGIYSFDNSPITINGATFTNNRADNGAGMYCYEQSSPHIRNAIFRSNHAKFNGGGMYVYKHSGATPPLENVVFALNTAREGAGLALRSGASPVITNSVFAQNTATAYGGGLFAYNRANAQLKYVTFFDNIAAGGPDIYAHSLVNLNVSNAIIWADIGNAARATALLTSSLAISNSLVRNLGATNHSGSGNIESDPLFFNPGVIAGGDGLFRTADDGLFLSDTSPALTLGGSSNFPATDVTGSARQAPTSAGAYHGSAGAAPLPPPSVTIEEVEAGTGTDEVASGDEVGVLYTGTLTNGTQFDSNVASGVPFTFTVGSGSVISGMSQGVMGMKLGGKRRLTVPPSLGYGDSAFGQVPPNSTLIFEVELVSLTKAGG